MRAALAQRDIGRMYTLLTAAGVPQHGIARLTGQSPSEVSEIVAGRQVKQVEVLRPDAPRRAHLAGAADPGEVRPKQCLGSSRPYSATADPSCRLRLSAFPLFIP